MKARAASAPASDFFGGLAMAAAILYAGYEGMAGRLELNQFASFVGAMLLAQTPVRSLSQLWTAMKEGLGAARARVRDDRCQADRSSMLRTRPELKIARAPFGGSVRFENVSFAYHPGADALDKFTLRRAGRKEDCARRPIWRRQDARCSICCSRFYDVSQGSDHHRRAGHPLGDAGARCAPAWRW